MGRRKKEIKQLDPENLTDIQGEFEAEEKIIESTKNKNPKKKQIKKNSSSHDEDDYLKNNNNSKKKENKIILDAVKKITEMYPDLKKDKNKLILSLLAQKNENNNPMKSQNCYLLHKIEINDKIYYRDNEFNIVDENLNLVGQYFCPKLNVYEYNFF